MIHRAVLGSFERFIGVLIENYAGKLPLWLAPNQITICSITSDVNDYAKKIHKQLQELNIRSKLDLRNEKISYKIREHSNAKVPNIVVLGKNEVASNIVTVRKLGSSDNFSYSLSEYIELMVKEASPK